MPTKTNTAKAKTAKKTSAPKSQPKIDVEFEFERDTKNTRRFKEVSDDPIIGTLYVQKSAFKGTPPESITVTIHSN